MCINACVYIHFETSAPGVKRLLPVTNVYCFCFFLGVRPCPILPAGRGTL